MYIIRGGAPTQNLSALGTFNILSFDSKSLSLGINVKNTTTLGNYTDAGITSLGFGMTPDAKGVTFTDASDGGFTNAELTGNGNFPGGFKDIDFCVFTKNNCSGSGTKLAAGSSDYFQLNVSGDFAGGFVNIDPFVIKFQTSGGSFEFAGTQPLSPTEQAAADKAAADKAAADKAAADKAAADKAAADKAAADKAAQNVNSVVKCIDGKFTGTLECEGPFAGNDSNTVTSSTTFFGKTGWKDLTKIDTQDGVTNYANDLIKFANEGGNDWSWEFGSNFDPSLYADLLFSVKGGPSYSVYSWDEFSMSGIFNTLGIYKGNGNPGPGLSHLSVYVRDCNNCNVTNPPKNVPTPAAILPTLGGLFGMATRRKQEQDSDTEA